MGYFARLAGISSPGTADGPAEQCAQFAGFLGSSITLSGPRDETRPAARKPGRPRLGDRRTRHRGSEWRFAMCSHRTGSSSASVARSMRPATRSWMARPGLEPGTPRFSVVRPRPSRTVNILESKRFLLHWPLAYRGFESLPLRRLRRVFVGSGGWSTRESNRLDRPCAQHVARRQRQGQQGHER